MMPRCFCVNIADNVATLLDNATAGEIQILGESAGQIVSSEPIALGHKIALRDIAVGRPIVKFGISIGKASRDIRAGQWVHLHNCESNFDARSQTFDVHSGAATDTKYE
jgi:altronate dehydratase small subunit